MAERRMFAKSIINSGRFLRMPPTSRLLYYDLGMMADDDGIVEAYSVMAQTKATEDDLRVLVAKGYIRILNDDLVSLICDWNTNNSIRSDRYHPSIYAELLELPDSGMPNDNQMATNGIPNDNQMDTEVSIGKVSIGKDNIKRKIKKEKVSGFDSIIEEYTQDENLKQTIVDFIGMRKAIKHQMTDKALKMMLTKLDGLSSTVDGKIKILEQSIFHSWQGVFPLKEEPEEQQTGDGIKWQ